MTRSRLIIAATAVIVAIAVGGFVVYDQVLRGDSDGVAAGGAPFSCVLLDWTFDQTRQSRRTQARWRGRMEEDRPPLD